MDDIEKRIIKDIDIFKKNIAKIDESKLSEEEKNVVNLAKMYASDSKDWLSKKDYYTSFSSIAYAHGLLDSILKIKHME